MLSSDRPEQAAAEGIPTDARPACTALVPVIPTVHWSRVPDQIKSRADFVTHLIATAEHAPQTCSFRRATPLDAQHAYQANRHPGPSAGIRTRQVI